MTRQALNTTINRSKSEKNDEQHLIRIGALSLALLMGGCVAPGRLADLGDCGTFGVGIGYGLDATLRLGAVAEGSIGVGHRIAYYGWDDVRGAGKYRPAQISWPLSLPLSAIDVALDEQIFLAAFNQSFFFVADDSMNFKQRPGNRMRYRAGKEFGYFIPLLSERRRKSALTFHNCTKIEGDVALGAVGVRAGINPLEILDFLLGFFGFDIAHDDQPLPLSPESGRMETKHDLSN